MIMAQSVEQRHTVINQMLKRFGESLKCDEDYYTTGNELAHNVFEKLKTTSNFSVARVHYAGSFGKKTDVIEPDLDLIVVVNNLKDCQPPFKKVLEDFENILTYNEKELKIIPDTLNLSKSGASLGFSFTNGINVDVLVAVNLDTDEVLDKISENEKRSYYYSPSLVQKTLAFMKSQDSFAHSIVRLAKFWFKSFSLESNISGGSAMMELIAVAAAEEEKHLDQSPSTLRAFTRFMEYMIKMDTFKLAFEEISDDCWQRVPANRLNYQNSSTLVPSVVGNIDVLNGRRFIVEPANPYNDFLSDLDSGIMSKLKEFAQITRQRIDQLMHWIVVARTDEEMQDFIEKLFEPHQKNIKKAFPSGVPDDALISYTDRPRSVLCDQKVRNEAPMKRFEVNRVVDIAKSNLFSVVKSFVKAHPDTVTTEKVAEVVRGYVEDSLQTKLVSANGKRHEDYDVTLCVPYHIGSELYAIRYSMKWKKI